MIGLQRSGVAKEEILTLQQAYKTLFNKEDGRVFAERIQELETDERFKQNALVQKVVEFVKNPSKNNILQPD